MSRSDFKLVKNVPVTSILLDVENARIRAGTDQADCIARILRKEDQLMTLMESIAKDGLSTIPILVSPAEKRQFIVRDGNRRVTALKLLNEPTLCMDERVRARIKALAKQYKANLVAVVDVLSSTDEEAMIREVVARHSGAQAGAGQLDWSAYLRTIYLVNHGHHADYERPAKYVFWAEEQGISVDDEFPITTVQRFFTLENLAALGFRTVAGDLVPTIAVETAKAMAQRVITDFQLGRDRGGKSVDDVRTTEQAKAYIIAVRAAAGLAPPPPATPSTAAASPPSSASGSVPAAPTAPTSAPVSSSTGSPAAAPTPAATPAPTPTPKTPPWDRTKLFGRGPPNIGIPESERKACGIVTELRQLNVKDTPLAVAALLRTLIEHSDAHYRTKHSLPDKNHLHKNVLASATRMRDAGKLAAGQFDVVSRFAASGGAPDLLHIEMLQKIMHRDTHYPTYQLINTFWESIGDFVRQCWAR